MRLSAPTTIVFIISVVLAVLALLAFTSVLAVIPISSFWLMTIAYVVLVAGCVFNKV